MALRLESDSIRAGEAIPQEYAFGVPDGEGRAAPEGGNRSPHLRWSGAPEGTRSFAVACVDFDVPADMDAMNRDDRTIPPDAERSAFVHWVAVDIPADRTEIPEGAASDGITPGGKPTGETRYGGVTGANGYTQFMADDPDMAGTYGNYDGPFPPWNDELVHRYRFRLYALDTDSLGLSGEFTFEDAQEAMEGHVLDETELVGTYALNEDAVAPRP
jgi:Raf kinase inhibitor-like YbhB/YbcL family protein